MTTFFITYIVISIFSFISIVYFKNQVDAVSFGIGSFLMLINLLLMAWAWSRIFAKKSVALAAGVIVFKYAILGLIIYLLVRDPRVSTGWFLIGLSVLLPNVLVYAFIYSRNQIRHK